MAAEGPARARYESRQLLSARATSAAVQAWARISSNDIAGSWAQQVPRLTSVVTTAQRVAATGAGEYVTEALAEQGVRRAADAEVLAEAFAGAASDGRPLGSLLAQPAITTLARIGVGFDLNDALASGRAALSAIVATQVADAGRLADGVAIATRPRTGYVRMLNPPSCSRCAVLAGRFYRWNGGFLRHPHCHCVHIPSVENIAGDVTTDPRAYFDSLSKADQDRIFTNAGGQAIRDGADVAQVVNARRGMAKATTGFTREGVTRTGRVGGSGAQGPLGRAGRRLGRTGGTVRLTPESIYEVAGDDRDLALSLLRQHGYIA